VESSHAEELVKSPSESLQFRAERPVTCQEWCTQVGSLFFCCVFVSLQQEYDGATGYRRPRVISGEQGLTYQKSRALVRNSRHVNLINFQCAGMRTSRSMFQRLGYRIMKV
jgi:hypothetical protein